MKSLQLLLLFALTAGITASCSKTGGDKPQAGSSPGENLPESQVVDIVNAVTGKDVAKVTSMLKANPKLVKAKFTAGGPHDGWPLLMIAAEEGSKPMVELLINSGADVNDKNDSSEVALDYAALGGYKEIVQILLDHNADINVKNDAGATPLSAASSAGKNDIVALLKQHGAKE